MGMVLHKDSRFYQSWQNFKDNNQYVTSKLMISAIIISCSDNKGVVGPLLLLAVVETCNNADGTGFLLLIIKISSCVLQSLVGFFFLITCKTYKRNLPVVHGAVKNIDLL